MGHITVDRLDEGWRKLERAETLSDSQMNAEAVRKCSSALDDFLYSAKSMGMVDWYTETVDDAYEQVKSLKRSSDVSSREVEEAISLCRDVGTATRDKVLPELREREDITQKPSRF